MDWSPFRQEYFHICYNIYHQNCFEKVQNPGRETSHLQLQGTSRRSPLALNIVLVPPLHGIRRVFAKTRLPLGPLPRQQGSPRGNRKFSAPAPDPIAAVSVAVPDWQHALTENRQGVKTKTANWRGLAFDYRFFYEESKLIHASKQVDWKQYVRKLNTLHDRTFSIMFSPIR